jgi:hypothetical protein
MRGGGHRLANIADFRMGHERRFRDVCDEPGLPPTPEILRLRSDRHSEQHVTSARQRGENPVGSFSHAHFGQHMDVVSQSRIDSDQTIIFGNRLGEIMPSFLV